MGLIQNADSFDVLLFPADLSLETGMFLHAIAFDTLDLATLLQGTGADERASAVPLSHANPYGGGVFNRGDGGTQELPPSFASPIRAAFSPLAARANASAARHNISATNDVAVPWCFAEQDEDHNESVIGALIAGGEKSVAVCE
jgi:hypothetical protein